MSKSLPAAGRTINTGLLILRVLLAVAFLAAGSMKLAGAPAMVTTFELVGVGQWFRYVTGVLEVGGAVLLLVPSTVAFGAALMAIICFGAFLAQILVLHGDPYHAIVPALILAVVAWRHRRQFGIRSA